MHSEEMADQPPAHTDRRRAGAFGYAAENYHRYRPRYPKALIDSLVKADGERALDVGAGTGIASMQLRGIGVNVLALEPDPRMARVAADHGIPIEVTTFEDWTASGRLFDLVVFAQSFHWVDPDVALPKARSILRPGGRLALLSNRVTPLSPERSTLDEAYVGILDAPARPAIDAVHNNELMTTVQRYGYSIERRSVTEHLHYTADDWVNMMLTYSNVATLSTATQSKLSSRLRQRIGHAGVDAQNEAVAVTCKPSGDPVVR